MKLTYVVGGALLVTISVLNVLPEYIYILLTGKIPGRGRGSEPGAPSVGEGDGARTTSAGSSAPATAPSWTIWDGLLRGGSWQPGMSWPDGAWPSVEGLPPGAIPPGAIPPWQRDEDLPKAPAP
jgi:hypothetical protein